MQACSSQTEASDAEGFNILLDYIDTHGVLKLDAMKGRSLFQQLRTRSGCFAVAALTDNNQIYVAVSPDSTYFRDTVTGYYESLQHYLDSDECDRDVAEALRHSLSQPDPLSVSAE